jgi:hypothetical protein
LSELKAQKMTLEHHVACAQVLYDKGGDVWTLTGCAGKDLTVDGDLELEMNGSEYVDHQENQPKGVLEKLMYAVMLNVFLQT